MNKTSVIKLILASIVILFAAVLIYIFVYPSLNSKISYADAYSIALKTALPPSNLNPKISAWNFSQSSGKNKPLLRNIDGKITTTFQFTIYYISSGVIPHEFYARKVTIDAKTGMVLKTEKAEQTTY